MSGEFRRAGNPELLARLESLRDEALSNPDLIEPTFRCYKCRDTQFITRVDSKGRVYGSKCDCLRGDIADKVRDSALRFVDKHRPRRPQGDDVPF
jgi:hypothetical protein